MAQKAAEAIRQKTRRTFDLKTEFIPKGIGIQSAKKADVKMGRASSAVFTKPLISGFMPVHEEGGTRKPTAHSGAGDKGRVLTIPSEQLETKSYRTKSGAVKKRYKPSTLLQQKKGGGRKKLAFVIRGSHSGVPIIARRRTKERYPLEILYVFSRRAKYRPVWEFEDTVRASVYQTFRRTFEMNLQAAVASAKGNVA